MKISLLTLTLFSVTSLASAMNRQERENINYALSSYMTFKLMSIANEQFYGEGGKSPQSEKDLMKLCSSSSETGGLALELEDKKRNIQRASGKSQAELLQYLSGLDNLKYSSTAELVVSTNSMFESFPGPRVIGFCDFHDETERERCNINDEKCSKATNSLRSEFQKFASETNILDMSFSAFCNKFMKTWVRAQDKAIGDIEMCRLNEEAENEAKEKNKEKENPQRNLKQAPSDATPTTPAGGARGAGATSS